VGRPAVHGHRRSQVEVREGVGITAREEPQKHPSADLIKASSSKAMQPESAPHQLATARR
jgi:hypothetical protein